MRVGAETAVIALGVHVLGSDHGNFDLAAAQTFAASTPARRP